MMPGMKAFIVAILFLVFQNQCLAWGHAGHQMAAELAMSMLSDATQAKVEHVLNGMTPTEADTRMDDIRDDPKHKYTAPWHFVNLNKGEVCRATRTNCFPEILEKIIFITVRYPVSKQICICKTAASRLYLLLVKGGN